MIPADWHPDPTGKHELRYWDGNQWTEHVADAGVQATDPLDAPGPDTGAAQEVSYGHDPHGGDPAYAARYGGEQVAEDTATAPVAEDTATAHEATETPVAEAAAAAAPVTAGHQPTASAGGISGDLIDGRYGETTSSAPGPMLQNDKMLRVRLAEPFMARQGAMVAYQGPVTFNYQGGGAGKFLKKAFTGEGLSLMRVEGQGDAFLADTQKRVHILRLANSGISINGDNVLAFSASLDWNIERVKGGSMAAGGLFNTTLRGTGWVAITTEGDPVVLDAGEAPTFADAQALVAWSIELQTSIKSTMTAGSLVGRGSGEAFQVAFNGRGFVIVQPSEGGVPPHTH
ncbi:AIM24 family protein [Nocardioides panacisoli]|uniref:AIM24 family protein n=1 Tax=Nocardioides panacisoli TaxID=627624 RepID=UPI001C631A7A|nr:AIM24 family protein [Nocardioides panacisoli]QYJ05754.1 AIM24 family protein [Nocardioides panacisoli]